MGRYSPYFTLMLPFLLVQYCVMSDSNLPNLNTDLTALLALKSAITSNILTDNWTTGTFVCDWVGVTCGRHQRVISLDIPRMGLEGSIPPEIGNLSFLVSLNISRNSFRGNLPQELAGLHRLQVIDFTLNNFEGELPKSWLLPSSLPRLQFLRLSGNSLQGMIPEGIGNMGRLKDLRLARNRFTGSIPSTIFNISTLEILYLNNNSFSGRLPVPMWSHNMCRLRELLLGNNMFYGAIPLGLYRCSKLQVLDLTSNNFTGHVAREIGNMTDLRLLYLSVNNLTGFIPEEIVQLHELEELGLALNFLSGTIPVGIFNMSNLVKLSLTENFLSERLPTGTSFNLPRLDTLFLGFNHLEGTILSFITNCSNLVRLDVASNYFSGSIPNTFGNNLKLLEWINLYDNEFTSDQVHSSQELGFITSLTDCKFLGTLELSNNPLGGILPPSIGNISKNLNHLGASDCMLNGPIPKEIGNLSNVEYLALYDNDLVGLIPMEIRWLQKIQVLVLRENNLIGSLPDGLCTFQNLGRLSLGGNQISGSIPKCLGNVTSLRYINLWSNKLNSSIPEYFWQLTDLLVLNISSNFISGSLSPSIGNLKMAYTIDLSVNEFSGGIPSTIVNLQSLMNLSLQHNRLQGSIPDELSKMVGLERLDLSHNNLSGVIPKSLELLQHLVYLNVSFNYLSGEIPLDGPFRNFIDQSFMFNKDLCGSPRFNVPPCHLKFVHYRTRKLKKLKIVFVSLAGVFVVIATVVILVLIMYQKKKQTFHVSNLLSLQRQSRISYYQLQQATDGFNESNLLGTGGFASVYKGVLGDGVVVAVKVFNLEVQGSLTSFDSECEVLRNLRHRNLAKVISSCSSHDFKALVLDYMPNGSLERWLYSHNFFLNTVQRLNIMMDVACALEYLHHGYSTIVIHCDLKPGNVLLDQDMTAHVGDFGVAKLLNEEDSTTHTTTLATLGYMAPEYGMEGRISPKCDVYSYGIMLMEVFTRKKPNDEMFAGELSMKMWVQNSVPNQVLQVVDANLLDPISTEEKLNEGLTSVLELALSCTAPTPGDRPSMKMYSHGCKKSNSTSSNTFLLRWPPINLRLFNFPKFRSQLCESNYICISTKWQIDVSSLTTR